MPAFGRKFHIPFFINATDLAAGTTQYMVAPDDGHITDIQGIVQTVIGTGGGITVTINGVAVAGLQLTVADAAAVGTVYTDTPDKPSVTRQFKKGDKIGILPAAAFATTGAVNGWLNCRDTASMDDPQ